MSLQLKEPPSEAGSATAAQTTPAPDDAPTASKPKRRPISIPEDEPEGLFERWKVGIVLLLIVGAITGAVLVLRSSDDSPPPRKKIVEEPTVRISPLPTPPPPPPPPPPKVEQPKMEEKMIAEEKPEDTPPEPEPDASDPPPAGFKSDGPPDGFGARAGGGGGTGRGTLGGNKNRSRWGWYAGQVQKTVADVLRQHRRTKSAAFSTQVKIWPDSSGRVTRVVLANSSGDAALDEALRNEVLSGLQLSSPPPADMPMPINLRLSLRRP